MDPKSEKSVRLFINPFTIWSDLAFKTGQAMWASAHAAAVQANTAANVAVIPTGDAPAPNAPQAAKPADDGSPKVAVLPAANAPRKARATARQPSQAARFNANRAKLRRKASAKRR
jgi:hypothetical protein